MASLHLHLFASIVLLLVSSSLRMAQAERHKQVASANSHCNINCVNDGYCSFTKYTDYPQQGDIGYYKACTCRPGFGGGACEKVIEECQAPHFKCHNGAPCETQEDGSLGCECSFADAKSEMAGYMCRRPVMQECNTLDEDNKSFCTNGGMCLSSMTASSKHLMFSGPTTWVYMLHRQFGDTFVILWRMLITCSLSKHHNISLPSFMNNTIDNTAMRDASAMMLSLGIIVNFLMICLNHPLLLWKNPERVLEPKLASRYQFSPPLLPFSVQYLSFIRSDDNVKLIWYDHVTMESRGFVISF